MCAFLHLASQRSCRTSLMRPQTSLSSSSVSHHGFSLVELMFALVILSVGVLGMASLMIAVSRSEMRSTARVELTEVVQNKLEELRAAAAAGTPDTVELNVGGTLGTPVADHVDTITSSAGRWYVRTWEVSTGPGGTRTVTVRGDARDSLVFAVPSVAVTTQILVN